MPVIRPLVSSVARLSAIFGLVVSADAALFWDGGATDIAGDGDSASAGGTGTWDLTIKNWDAGAVPHVAWTNGNDAVFGGTGGTVTVGTSLSAGNISFTSTGYTIATTSGALTLTGGVTNVTGLNTISDVGGLNLSGAQAFDVTGGLVVSTAISGSATITKSGSGMLGFSGANTGFTGKINITAGRFGLNGDAALGAVPGALVADSLTINGGILTDGIPTNANGTTFSNGGVYTINANRGVVIGNLGGTIQVGYNAAGRITIAGPVSGTGVLTKTDSGDLALLGANTYSGGTTISGGAVIVGELTTGGSSLEGTSTSLGTGDVNVAGGQLILSGTNISIPNNVTLNGSVTVNNRVGGLIGGFQSGASANTLTGTLTLAGTGLRNVSTWWSDKSLTLAGKVTGTGGLQVNNIAGAAANNEGGVIILGNAANDYSGDTVVANNGLSTSTVLPTLRLGASDVIPDGAGKGNVTVNGRLDVNNQTDTINGLSGTGAIALGTGTLIVGNTDAGGTFSGGLSGGAGGSLRKIGSGTLTLSGTGDNSGGRARVDAGTLVLAKASTGSVHAVGSGGGTDYALVITGGTAQLAGSGGDQIYVNSAVNITGGTLDLGGTSEGFDGLVGTGGVVSNSVAAATSTLTVGQNNSAGSPVYSGVIQDGAGIVALTKAGTGTQTLAGANTYTGATTVNAGTLVVSGSLSGGSAVTIGDAANPATVATLGGAGSVGAVSAITSGAVISPGNVPGGNENSGTGTLSTGALSLQNGAHLSLELGASTIGGALTLADRINVTGTVNLTGADLQISLFNAPAISSGQTFTLISNDGTSDAIVGTFATINGVAFTPGASFFVGGQEFQLSFQGEGGVFNAGAGLGNDVVLRAVPEPASMLMLLAGATLLGLRRPSRSARA
ncbi:beta strand repeat-containing protein [Verrucomicrobiota bacterium sgz303538]